MRLLLPAAAALLAASALCQTTIPIPAHASIYNGYSRGFNYTANTSHVITGLDLPTDAHQPGDTAGYIVRVNGAVALHSVGNGGAISAALVVNTGDVVDVVGNWSPVATGYFTAHNSYGSSAPFASTINGVPHTLNRVGYQWDIGDPGWAGGSWLAPTTGSIGRVLVSIAPLTGLYAAFDATPTTGYTPLTVNFTDQSTTSDPVGIQAWAWDFDNDGVIDSILQNPTHTYASAGTYDVSLTVFDTLHQPGILVRTGLISVSAVGPLPAQPELLQYQFNEVRGDEPANTAATAAAPPHGQTSAPAWSGGAGRFGFQGNEAGFGCLDGAVGVDSGWPVNISGSFSISFCIRKDPNVTTTNPFGYVFHNGTLRAYVAGASGPGAQFAGSPAFGTLNAYNNIVNVTPGVWRNMILVVDDAVGRASWYDDGQETGWLFFTPNTFSHTGANLWVGSDPSGANPLGAYWAIDDFRVYSRALSPAEAMTIAVAKEHATAGSFGSSCNGASGTPVIAGVGVPTSGNLGYMLEMTNADPGVLGALVFDLGPSSSGTFIVDPWLTGPGCVMQVGNKGAVIGLVSASGTMSLPVPIQPGFEGWHIYTQGLFLGSSGGGVTRVLDTNMAF